MRNETAKYQLRLVFILPRTLAKQTIISRSDDYVIVASV